MCGSMQRSQPDDVDNPEEWRVRQSGKESYLHVTHPYVPRDGGASPEFGVRTAFDPPPPDFKMKIPDPFLFSG